MHPGPVDPKALVPLNVCNLAGWWAADAIVGKANNDPIAQWNDLSGNGYHFTQSNPVFQPLYKTAQKNGLPGLLFDNTDDGFTSTLWLVAPFTVFAVYAATNTTGNHRVLNGGTYNWLIGPYGGNYQYNNGLFISDGAITAGQYNIFAATNTATAGQFWKNNTAVGTNSAGVVPGFLTMGSMGIVAEKTDSTVLELMAYTRVLDTDELTAIYQYLSFKYAI